jgi:hypothetical protein
LTSTATRGEVDGRHHGDTNGNGLSLGGHQDDLLVDLDVGFVSQKTGDHELGTVADGVDSGVFDDDSLEGQSPTSDESSDPSSLF